MVFWSSIGLEGLRLGYTFRICTHELPDLELSHKTRRLRPSLSISHHLIHRHYDSVSRYNLG